tara:strand:+ start:2057 stop:3256 length:1200 start_codon:yes stop_codon:yes gene_type:complete
MKIGYFVEYYKMGGIDTFITNLLSKNLYNDDIYLIYNKNNPGINNLKKNKLKAKFISYSIFSWDKILNNYHSIYIIFLLKIIYSIFFPLLFAYQIVKLYFFFKKISLDKILIINGGYPGGDVCLAAAIVWSKMYPNKKPWMNFHNFALKKHKSFLLDFYKNLIDKVISKSVLGFVSVSNICTNSIKLRKNLKKNKTFTIYNGHAFTNKRKNFFLRKKFKLSRDAKILLLLAEYDLRKGHKYLIQVMEEIILKDKNIYLFIFGNGDRSIVRNLVSDSKASKNIFLNNFEKNQFNLIKQTDCLVIASQKYESFGYTAIEAMSLKKTVISTNFGGLNEVILNNITGYLVDKNKPKLFAKKVLYLLGNKKTKKKMEIKSYLHYKKFFTNLKMIKNYNNLIKNK